MKTYEANSRAHGNAVVIHDSEGARDRELDPAPSQRIVNHSPDGFAWGYGGSGPSQLALAVLMDLFPVADALAVYQDFKWAFVAMAGEDGFVFREDDVRQFVNHKLALKREDIHA
jgi:hypothetical protein